MRFNKKCAVEVVWFSKEVVHRWNISTVQRIIDFKNFGFQELLISSTYHACSVVDEGVDEDEDGDGELRGPCAVEVSEDRLWSR